MTKYYSTTQKALLINLRNRIGRTLMSFGFYRLSGAYTETRTLLSEALNLDSRLGFLSFEHRAKVKFMHRRLDVWLVKRYNQFTDPDPVYTVSELRDALREIQQLFKRY